MGKIIKKLTVVGDAGEASLKVLLDSGAGSSLIRRDVAEKVSRNSLHLGTPKVFRMANGGEGMRSSDVRVLALRMKGKELDGSFYVVDTMPREMILGFDFMQKWEISLRLKEEDYAIGVDPEAIEIA